MGKGFDLSSLGTREQADEGAKMIIQDVSGEPVIDSKGKPVFILLAGMDSNKFRMGSKKAREDVLQGKRKMSEQDVDAIGIYTKAACTLSWSGIVAGGKAVECTFDNACKLFETYPALNEQVADFMADRINFTKGS